MFKYILFLFLSFSWSSAQAQTMNTPISKIEIVGTYDGHVYEYPIGSTKPIQLGGAGGEDIGSLKITGSITDLKGIVVQQRFSSILKLWGENIGESGVPDWLDLKDGQVVFSEWKKLPSVLQNKTYSTFKATSISEWWGSHKTFFPPFDQNSLSSMIENDLSLSSKDKIYWKKMSAKCHKLKSSVEYERSCEVFVPYTEVRILVNDGKDWKTLYQFKALTDWSD